MSKVQLFMLISWRMVVVIFQIAYFHLHLCSQHVIVCNFWNNFMNDIGRLVEIIPWLPLLQHHQNNQIFIYKLLLLVLTIFKIALSKLTDFTQVKKSSKKENFNLCANHRTYKSQTSDPKTLCTGHSCSLGDDDERRVLSRCKYKG